MSIMVYKDFIATVSYIDKKELFEGVVEQVPQIEKFYGCSVVELKDSFKTVINSYLFWCKKNSVEPQKSYSGSFNVRITPGQHRELVMLAKKRNITLNALMRDIVKSHIDYESREAEY